MFFPLMIITINKYLNVCDYVCDVRIFSTCIAIEDGYSNILETIM